MRRARADGHACFRAALPKQIECENGGGFSRRVRVDGALSGAGAPGGVCISGLEPVYARVIISCPANRGSSGYTAFSALRLHRELLSHRCFSNPSRTAAKPKVSGSSTARTRKAQDSFCA